MGECSLGRSQAVRQRILIPPFGGSIPPAPANILSSNHRFPPLAPTRENQCFFFTSCEVWCAFPSKLLKLQASFPFLVAQIAVDSEPSEGFRRQMLWRIIGQHAAFKETETFNMTVDSQNDFWRRNGTFGRDNKSRPSGHRLTQDCVNRVRHPLVKAVGRLVQRGR